MTLAILALKRLIQQMLANLQFYPKGEDLRQVRSAVHSYRKAVHVLERHEKNATTPKGSLEEVIAEAKAVMEELESERFNQAIQPKASLGQEEEVAPRILSDEEVAGLESELRRVWPTDPDGNGSVVAPSLGQENESRPADDHPGV